MGVPPLDPGKAERRGSTTGPRAFLWRARAAAWPARYVDQGLVPVEPVVTVETVGAFFLGAGGPAFVRGRRNPTVGDFFFFGVPPPSRSGPRPPYGLATRTAPPFRRTRSWAPWACTAS